MYLSALPLHRQQQPRKSCPQDELTRVVAFPFPQLILVLDQGGYRAYLLDGIRDRAIS